MRKLLLIILFFGCILSTSYAKINHEVNKHGVMSVYFLYQDSMPNIQMFHEDWVHAVVLAKSNKKVKQIQFKDSKNNLFAWLDKAQFSEQEKEYQKLVESFDESAITEKVYGDSVLVSNVVPAEYRSTTYRNGKKVSTYSSNWRGGQIPTRTSTYSSGSNKYTNTTQVIPTHVESHWDKPVKDIKVIKTGEEVKLMEIYKKE